MSVALTGCAATGSGKVQSVTLPPPPVCMSPVPVPAVRAGDDARAALARHRAALVEANGRLNCSERWYGKVRSGYAVTQ